MMRNFRDWATRFASRLKVWRRAISDEDLDRVLSGLGQALTAVVDDHPQATLAYRDRFVEWLQAGDALRAAEEVGSSRRPTTAADVPGPLSPATRLEVVAARWSMAIGSESYVSEDLSPDLSEFLREFTLHVVAPEQTRIPVDRIGYELAQRIKTTPAAFGQSLRILSEFFRSLEERLPQTSDWTPVIGRFGEGYAAGTRARALEGQDLLIEALHRAKEAAVHAALINARFHEILHTAPIPMGIANPDGRITTANDALRRLIGEDVPVIDRDLASLAHDDDSRTPLWSLHPAYDDASEPAQEFRLATSPYATPVWVRVHWGRHRNDEDVPGEIPFVLEDVTQHRALRRWLDHSTRYDGAFDMPSKRHFMDRLSALSSTRNNGRVGMFAVRFDNMDAITAHYGSAASGKVAKELAARTRAAAEQAEMVTQLDATTIAILVAGPDQWAAIGPAIQLLVQSLTGPVAVTSKEAVSIVPLIGAVTDGPPHGDADSLIRWLDHSLDTNRRTTNSSQPRVIPAAEAESAASRVVEAAGLGQAIATDGVRLRHAPIGSARSARILGSHVTLHWRHPTMWRTPINEVLDLADTFGTTAAAGHWMISRAAETAARWYQKFGERSPFVRIDLPGRKPLTDTLFAHLAAELARYRFPERLLQLSVPVSALLDDDGRSWRELVGLTGNGIALIINGFGEHLNRMPRLTGTPFNGAVLDPQLAANLFSQSAPTAQDVETKPVVQALIECADTLSLETTVPGISTREQRDAVRRLGATLIEGDLTGCAGTEADLEAVVSRSMEIHAVAK
ncbi:hypothetical protein ALI144C_33120 [Actinosynnema sp. ALI-1.44]|uniref:EAL domain-containing protein n=1 Tax=Actinosynnema sp. ALI-1.44 TaxID=1933779 RepID=UPI00097C793F|nr:EAL domain-containing protein [Actinosynnema sp. ALI-1.44]ONI76964.1 hypothetical protein ALI144C_33120 [Actinosynnema sp. ALI-1.44]